MAVKQTAGRNELDAPMLKHAASMVFHIGNPNDGFAQYFSGKSFLAPVSTEQVGIFNVTFEPVNLKLKDMKAFENGAVWLRYCLHES